MNTEYSIAVDTGGTFTDLVVADQHSVRGLYKASTTKDDLMSGIGAALELAAGDLGTDVAGLLGRTRSFVYSTTHSTNALLTGNLAKTAFVTTRGYRDTLLYREGGKDDVFNWAMRYPKPYIPRRLSFELSERVFADGTIGVPLDETEVRQLLNRLAELEVEAIAVSLIWSPANATHEIRVGQLIEEMLPGVPYSLGHRVNGITREFRRGMATAIDASLKPLMRKHLRGIESSLADLGFAGEPLMVTHVSGGVLHLDDMIDRPLHTIDSGPALAPIAGMEYGRAEPNASEGGILVVDTGGTSFDVSLIDEGRVAFTREKWVGPQWYGFMTGLPAVDTRSIGAGGGSIAYVDAGGLLHVGPQAAGAYPGPVCYGRGGIEPTVTDAALILGYLDPANFLGGKMTLDVDNARHALITRVAAPLGLSVEAAAEAIIAIASEHMRGLINEITTGQGRDVRECLMVAGGGAAGLNIVRIAREAGIGRVVIPRLAAGLSAVGGLFSDITALFTRGQFNETASFDYDGANNMLAEISSDMERFLARARQHGEQRRSFQCEARYSQQLWEIDIDVGDEGTIAGTDELTALQKRFDDRHLKLFSVNQPGEPLEITAWRGEARVVRPKCALALPKTGDSALHGSPSGSRVAYFDGKPTPTSVYSGPALAIGAMIAGPALIEEPTTTIVIGPGSSATVRPSHYLIEVGSD